MLNSERARLVVMQDEGGRTVIFCLFFFILIILHLRQTRCVISNMQSYINGRFFLVNQGKIFVTTKGLGRAFFF